MSRIMRLLSTVKFTLLGCARKVEKPLVSQKS